MKISRKCEVCGTPFIAIKFNNRFCKRQCFKIAYNRKKKAERQYDRKHNPARFGWYVCSHCGLKSPLPYSPKRYKVKFETYSCPGCGVPRFPNPSDMREEWEDDLIRFGQGWKTKNGEPYKDVVISMTFATFLSNNGSNLQLPD